MSSSLSSAVSRLACIQSFQKARPSLSPFSQQVCKRASTGNSQRDIPSSSTPSNHSPSSASLHTQPSSNALSRPCDQANAPIGNAGLISCISPSSAKSLVAFGCASVCMVMVVIMGMSMGMIVFVRMLICMFMCMRVFTASLRISTRFGIEWRLVMTQGCAQQNRQLF